MLLVASSKAAAGSWSAVMDPPAVGRGRGSVKVPSQVVCCQSHADMAAVTGVGENSGGSELAMSWASSM